MAENSRRAMSELAVALLLAALIAPPSAPAVVATPSPGSAQTAAAPGREDGTARTAHDVRESQPKNKRNDEARPDVKDSAVAQAPAVAK